MHTQPEPASVSSVIIPLSLSLRIVKSELPSCASRVGNVQVHERCHRLRTHIPERVECQSSANDASLNNCTSFFGAPLGDFTLAEIDQFRTDNGTPTEKSANITETQSV